MELKQGTLRREKVSKDYILSAGASKRGFSPGGLASGKSFTKERLRWRDANVATEKNQFLNLFKSSTRQRGKGLSAYFSQSRPLTPNVFKFVDRKVDVIPVSGKLGSEWINGRLASRNIFRVGGRDRKGTCGIRGGGSEGKGYIEVPSSQKGEGGGAWVRQGQTGNRPAGFPLRRQNAKKKWEKRRVWYQPKGGGQESPLGTRVRTIGRELKLDASTEKVTLFLDKKARAKLHDSSTRSADVTRRV